MPRVERAGGLDQRQREQRAGGLAEPEPEVEQRLEPELAEHELVPGLGARDGLRSAPRRPRGSRRTASSAAVVTA